VCSEQSRSKANCTTLPTTLIAPIQDSWPIKFWFGWFFFWWNFLPLKNFCWSDFPLKDRPLFQNSFSVFLRSSCVVLFVRTNFPRPRNKQRQVLSFIQSRSRDFYLSLLSSTLPYRPALLGSFKIHSHHSRNVYSIIQTQNSIDQNYFFEKKVFNFSLLDCHLRRQLGLNPCLSTLRTPINADDDRVHSLSSSTLQRAHQISRAAKFGLRLFLIQSWFQLGEST
jgi:hypothetical protein